MSDTSKSNDSRSSRSTSWNPFRKVLSMVTGSRDTDSNSSDGSKVILRWTVACLNTTCPIFSRNPQFNMIYSPAPSLLMYVIVTLASEHAMTKTLQKLFELSDEDIIEIREMSQKLTELRTPHEFYCFVRFLVDEERTTTVSKELMIRSNDVACQQVFSSIRPSRVVKYLNTLTFSPVSFNRPPLLTTNGYGSAGLNATWLGKTRKAGIHRFACTYHKKKFEAFFEIRTTYRTVKMEQFEVFEIPFKFGTSPDCFGSLLLLRPHFLGHLPYANRQLDTQSLSKMLDSLYDATWHPNGQMLIPQFSVNCSHDLWKNLVRHGVQPDLGQSHKAPPMASLWHWASLQVGSDGIRGDIVGGGAKKKKKMTASQKALQTTFHDRIPSEGLLEKHKPYCARIDSPFTYLVMVNGIPIFTGSYFGSPPPKSQEIFINAPERIRQRRTTVVRRRKAKETRKQKLLRKVRRSEEREKEKDRKRMRKRVSSSSTTSSESSYPPSPKVSEMVVVEEKKKREEEKKEKSKSSGWRRLANRLFKKRH
uniref:SERPIN domain-containing protein n=1 Tax=Caenorhabditis tropicalis TaxID=1561998 RepID=A0A1I7UIQ4_9PELO